MKIKNKIHYFKDNFSIIIQARTGSTRLPNKIIKKINNKTYLEILVDRLQLCFRNSKIRIIIATTNNENDDKIVKICEKNNYLYFRGSENNVLERYYQTAQYYNVENIIRITSDCILMDPSIILNMIEEYDNKRLDYLWIKYTNNEKGSKGGFPDGFNPEIFSFKLLEEAFNNADLEYDKEHVIPYMYKKYNKNYYIVSVDKNEYPNIDFNSLHLSLDTPRDLVLIKNILVNCYFDNFIEGKDTIVYKNHVTYQDVLTYLNKIMSETCNICKNNCKYNGLPVTINFFKYKKTKVFCDECYSKIIDNYESRNKSIVENNKSIVVDFKELPEFIGIENNSLFEFNGDIYSVFGYCNGIQLKEEKYKKTLLENNISLNFLGGDQTKHIRGYNNTLSKLDLVQNKWEYIENIDIKKDRSSVIVTKNKKKIYFFGGSSFTPLTKEEITKFEEELKLNADFNFKKNIAKKDLKNYSKILELQINKDKIEYINHIFPFEISNVGLVEHDKKIYLLGGELEIVEKGTSTEINNIGKTFLSIDLDEEDNLLMNTLKIYPDFPGSKRSGHIFFEFKDHLYVMNGLYQHYDEDCQHNIIDNWKYDIKNGEWLRISNSPYPMTSIGYCIYKEKYLIMCGGDKINITKCDDQIIPTDLLLEHIYDFNLDYTISTKKNNEVDIYNFIHNNNHTLSDLIIIYDIELDKYIILNDKLPISVVNPRLINYNDEIYIIGGEAAMQLVNNKYYQKCCSYAYKFTINL